MLALLLAALTAPPSQPYQSGPQLLTFLSDADDSQQPYALYLPPNFNPKNHYPLVISLHGAGSNHRLNLRRIFGKGNLPGETDAEASRRFPPLPDVDFIVACPLARGTMGYQGLAEKDVYDVLADVKKRFPVDEDRIYLTGLSMGGGGAMWLALTRPDLWAAVAAVCPAMPPGLEPLAANALNLPVHLFHGSLDPVVPVSVSRRWHRLLLTQDVHAEYIEYPGARHNSWDQAYKDAAIFRWFARFKRNRCPQRVRFASNAYKYRTAYWVALDGLTPGELASIDAAFTATNRIEVRTSALLGFSLNLQGHPSFDPARRLILIIDGAEIAVPPRTPLSFCKLGSRWVLGRYQPPPQAKRPQLEGPISEAFAARHIYVYGTASAGSPEEILRRKAIATQAARWSSARGPLLVSFRVLADQEVTDADVATSNLILFGDRQTNLLIARFSSHFPLELNPGAADYGLVFVAPLGNRLAVVNSGLPFWTGAEKAHRGFDLLSPPLRALQSFGDFILFKGSLVNVVAEGRFDAKWKIPPEAARNILATGAVRIR